MWIGVQRQVNMLRKTLAFIVLMTSAAVLCFSQSAAGPAQPSKESGPSRFNLSFTPALTLPMLGDASVFGLGATGDLKAKMTLPFMPLFYAGADLSYTFSPLRRNDTLSLISGGLEFGLAYQVIPSFLVLNAYAGGGYFFGFLNSGGGSGSNPVVLGGLGLSVLLPHSFSVGVSGSYRYFFGLYNDMTIAVGTAYHFGGTVTRPAVQIQPNQTRPTLLQEQEEMKPGTGLQISKVSLSDVYPIFYKFYDDHPVGNAILHNFEKVPVKNVKLSVFVKEYMSDPKEVAGPESVPAESDASVDLYGLFTKDILANTESTKVSAKVTISYTLNGAPKTQSQIQTLQVLRRNSLTWDDDRKAAAFVSPNDPTALKFAKNVQSMVRNKASSAIDQSVLLAIAIHNALTLYGLTYSSDPVATLNSDNKTVDYIQFSEQTLDYRGGKCSDFSVLYASMFEAVGLETAFITIPGHIFMAVALGMSPDQARKTFANPADLIFQDNKAWLPIEITLREGGFVMAWQLGAREWRESKARNEAAFYPLHEAWKIYQPVGFSSNPTAIQIPPEEKVVKAYQDEVDTFISSQIRQLETTLLSAVNKASNKTGPLNSLAVLYSRYGLYDKAVKVLDQILAKAEYVPALINMGNIYFIQSQSDTAALYYNRAYARDPDDATVLLCVARVNQALENYSIAKQAFAQLQKKDPDLASKYSFINMRGEEATRAADRSGLRTVVPWME